MNKKHKEVLSLMRKAADALTCAERRALDGIIAEAMAELGCDEPTGYPCRHCGALLDSPEDAPGHYDAVHGGDPDERPTDEWLSP